jgi:hypothetical protein
MQPVCPERSGRRRYVILAPPLSVIPESFRRIGRDKVGFESHLAAMQRVRGQLYLADGAITESQLLAGRHRMPGDAQSWHILMLSESDTVEGCMRYRLHPSNVSYSDLHVSHSSLSHCDRWGAKLRKSVQVEMSQARAEGLSYSEIGGWALAPQLRCTTEGLRLVLATYALAQLLGDALGICTATMRNGSAGMLRRIGGRPLLAGQTEIPGYFEPQYNCEMEALRFDSRLLNRRYSDWVDDMRAELMTAPVLCERAADFGTRLDRTGNVGLEGHRVLGR